MRLDGQAAIVTGGASGLGAATAQRLAAGGCRVALLDINQSAAEAQARHIGGIGIGLRRCGSRHPPRLLSPRRAMHTVPPGCW